MTAPGKITLTKLNRRPDLRVTNQTNHVCLESKAINLGWRLVSSKGHTGQGLCLASSQLRALSAAWWRLPLHCLANQGLLIISKVSESHSHPHHPPRRPVCPAWSAFVTPIPKNEEHSKARLLQNLWNKWERQVLSLWFFFSFVGVAEMIKKEFIKGSTRWHTLGNHKWTKPRALGSAHN